MTALVIVLTRGRGKLFKKLLGTQTVTLRKNNKNLGMAGHLREIAQIVKSQIIILGAGDDISLPERTEAIVNEFSRSSEVMAVFSAASGLTADGDGSGVEFKHHIGPIVPFSRIVDSCGGIGKGATYAYRKECFLLARQLSA